MFLEGKDGSTALLIHEKLGEEGLDGIDWSGF